MLRLPRPHSRTALLAWALLLVISQVTAAPESYDYYAGNWPSGLHDRVHEYHLAPGYEKLQRGSYRYAVKDANFILVRFPNDPKGLQLMMRIALKWPDNQLVAMPYFQRALDRYPKYGDTWLLYGIYLHRLDRLEQAVDAYRSAIERGANPAEAHYNLGLALVSLGELDEANRVAQKAYDLGYPLPGLRNLLRSKGAWDPSDHDT